jgi:hypothetical protein
VPGGRPAGVLVALSHGLYLAVSPDGHYRGWPEVEKELVYVVETDRGQETLTPKEFEKRFGWKNDPERVRPLDRPADETGPADGPGDVESFPPPPGARLLYDGKGLAGWGRRTVQVGEEWLMSKKTFGGRFRLHVEFRVKPREKPDALPPEGHVSVQGRYRVQITDSRGRPLDARTSCGAIYTLAAPRGGDAARRAGAWQSFDLALDPPAVEGQQVKRPARLSVWHNDFNVHDRVEVRPTPGALDARVGEPGPVVLYDGGGQVEFRNVWLRPLKEGEPARD